jgi:hypothetical protein
MTSKFIVFEKVGHEFRKVVILRVYADAFVGTM